VAFPQIESPGPLSTPAPALRFNVHTELAWGLCWRCICSGGSQSLIEWEGKGSLGGRRGVDEGDCDKNCDLTIVWGNVGVICDEGIDDGIGDVEDCGVVGIGCEKLRAMCGGFKNSNLSDI
jgi:hypothetical protein